MLWKVNGSLICPKTGVVYSSVVNLKYFKFIIWYESNVFLYPGDVLKLTKSEITVNGKSLPLTVYNVSPYNEMLWYEIKDKTLCPFNKINPSKKCDLSPNCKTLNCPYGFVTHPQVIKPRNQEQ